MGFKNKLLVIIIIIYTFIFFKSHAQNTEYNSYKNYFDSTTLYYNQGNNQKTIEFSNKALFLAEELEIDTGIINLLMIQGNIQRDNKLFIEANLKFHQVIDKSKELGDTISIFRGLISIGYTFIMAHDESGKFMPYIDSAAYYFELTHNYNYPENRMTPFLYEGLGHVELERKRYSKSLYYYNFVKNYHLNRNDSLSYFITNINAANSDIGLKQFRKAERNIQKSISFFKRNNKLAELSSSYFTISYLFQTEKNFKKAFQYRNLHHDMQDSIYKQETTNIIAELDRNYKFEKQQKEIKIKDEQNTRNTFWLILTTILLITLGIIFWLSVLRHRLKQKNLELLNKEQQLLQQSRLEQLEYESQHKIINAALDGREEERNAIAETLHNSVSALLSSANLHLQAFKKNISEERHQQILKTQSIIVEASGKIRDLSHNLVSSLLINFGLEYALHDICEKFTSTELEFHVESNLEHRYPANIELKIYHIMEELCNNTLKHSQASQASIHLYQSEDQLKITIQDNGIGFDTDKLPKKSVGIGLSQIEARIKNMKGIFSIYSKPKNGTLITLTLPIQSVEETNN